MPPNAGTGTALGTWIRLRLRLVPHGEADWVVGRNPYDAYPWYQKRWWQIVHWSRRKSFICRKRGHPLTVLQIKTPFVSQANRRQEVRERRCPCGRRSEEIPTPGTLT